jgi:predicted DsbA family dithiol-disulfide isomerase
LLRALGVTVTPLPFELHPRIPPEGRSLKDRWGARYAEADVMYRRIEDECAAVGLPFRRPEWIPNTRRALETAECVRLRFPAAFDALDRSLFAAHFVEGRNIGDADVLDELVGSAGADAAAVRAAVDAGELHAAVSVSMEQAMDADVTGTPAWLLDGRLLIPGVMPRELFERAVRRMTASED